MKRLSIDYENNSSWWHNGGHELWDSVAGNENTVVVSCAKAMQFLQKAETIEGWDDGEERARHPIDISRGD